MRGLDLGLANTPIAHASLTLKEGGHGQTSLHILLAHQKHVARRLAGDLERGAPAIPVGIDDKRLGRGDPLDDRIQSALEACRALVLLWSSKALASRYVQTEWLGATELRKTIITCGLDDTPVPLVLQSG